MTNPRNPFLAAAAIATLTLCPVLVIFQAGFNAEPDIWAHLVQFVLPELVLNSLILVIGVVGLTAFLGISLAWLTALHEFPGRRFFEKALLLPLAIPAYVMAFIYTGLLDFSGPVQTLIRSQMPVLAPWFPEIRSAGGVILVISLSLFPYVFLMTSSGFKSMGQSVIEASQSLYSSRFSTLLRVIIPMARPWIFGGLILVFMETLADFGAVSIFNYDTFTTGIYKAWYGLFSIHAAAGLASILVLIVLVLFGLEFYLRKKQQFFNANSHTQALRTPLTGNRGRIAAGYAGMVLGLAFVIPVVQLTIWTISSFGLEFNTHYFTLLFNTFSLGTMGMGLTMVTALVLVYCTRIMNDVKTGMAAKLSLAGYAMPGTVLAVGIIQMVAMADTVAARGLELFGIHISGPLFQGSLALLPLGYMVRFMTVGYNPLFANYTRITLSMDEAARLLKISPTGLVTKIHLPLIHQGFFTGCILVLVEIIKELPITLMLRPFGWDTLAVKIFELTSEGEWERAALPALTLVIFGMIPIFMLTRIGDKK